MEKKSKTFLFDNAEKPFLSCILYKVIFDIYYIYIYIYIHKFGNTYKNWFEFDKYKCKLENRCDNLFIRWQKIFEEGKKQRMLQRISKI